MNKSVDERRVLFYFVRWRDASETKTITGLFNEHVDREIHAVPVRKSFSFRRILPTLFLSRLRQLDEEMELTPVGYVSKWITTLDLGFASSAQKQHRY